MKMVCRVLPHDTGDGTWNMALDEALLESVAADPSAAIVRTYEWSAPTLSLGYFQRMSEAEAEPRWGPVPIVRRPTGGGALWHDLEVTYAVVVPSTHPAARPSRALYQAIHRAIAGRIQDLGIPAAIRGEFEPEKESAQRPFFCFPDRDSEDIVFRNAKLVGSAQRRRSGAVLQHGSLLLGRSTVTPELPGLSDLAPSDGTPSVWAEVLQTILPEALGLLAQADEVRPDERLKAEALRREVYDDPSWTRRR